MCCGTNAAGREAYRGYDKLPRMGGYVALRAATNQMQCGRVDLDKIGEFAMPDLPRPCSQFWKGFICGVLGGRDLGLLS